MFKNICWVNWLFAVMIGGLMVVSISTLLSGCGTKGPLVMPDKTSSHNVATPKKMN